VWSKLEDLDEPADDAILAHEGKSGTWRPALVSLKTCILCMSKQDTWGSPANVRWHAKVGHTVAGALRAS
jgi:hypothetical protein